jgi:hypothetical protein
MALMKKAATIAVLAGTGVVASAGIAAAACCGAQDNHGSRTNDNRVTQEGVIPANAANGVNVSPNAGCLLDRTVPDLTAQSLVGLVPIGVTVNHLLEHANINVLANGNTTTDVYDNSCVSNQGSSQAGNNSHGSMGAGDSASEHSTGDGAGAYNSEAGKGAGGLLGGTGILGTGV